jgi:hypothetical protein
MLPWLWGVGYTLMTSFALVSFAGTIGKEVFTLGKLVLSKKER